MSDEPSLLEFPCEVPVKVFGRNDDVFRHAARAITERHFGVLPADAVSEQLSRHASYLSLTIVVRAESREQIDGYYRELTAHDDIVMVL